MGLKTFSVQFTEDELISIGRALEHRDVNTKEQNLLLVDFQAREIGRAARSAWIKAGGAQRNIPLTHGGKDDDEQ
jgi:hypothetical protein